jgi:hypothetical protein
MGSVFGRLGFWKVWVMRGRDGQVREMGRGEGRKRLEARGE